ncbi:hypothetical protein [Streptomyces parvus]|uniref:hypothetical protein n=1 Tax=Streptomyces parvus TaxID=66428 RepID=UPI0036266E8B
MMYPIVFSPSDTDERAGHMLYSPGAERPAGTRRPPGTAGRHPVLDDTAVPEGAVLEPEDVGKGRVTAGVPAADPNMRDDEVATRERPPGTPVEASAEAEILNFSSEDGREGWLNSRLADGPNNTKTSRFGKPGEADG